MTDFLSKYMAYLQTAREKARGLKYFEMNKYFFQSQEDCHWQEKRPFFYHNHKVVLNNLDGDVDLAWQRHVRNYIARDNLFHFYSKIDKHWIENNVDVTDFNSKVGDLVRTRPVVYISTHSFFQVLIPMVLAQYLGPVYPFVLDEVCESNEVIRDYLAEMYDVGSRSLSGGCVLKVGGTLGAKSRSKSIEVLKQKGNIYAAIDMLHPSLGNHSKVSLSTSNFKFDVMAGVISLGLKFDAQFVFPFISLQENGALRLEMFFLGGSTTGEVLASFQSVFESLVNQDVASWEGASLMTFKDGRFV